jgi:hypothetical protein
MRVVTIAAVAIAVALPALAQEPSPPTNSVGSGTAKALEPGARHMVGKPVSPSTQGAGSQRHKATTMHPGSVPADGSQKPDGTTGAPPYGSSTPKPDSPTGADDVPHGG